MSDRYSEDEAIAAVARLTRPQLSAFIAAQIVVPLQTEAGLAFRQIDIVRMELLCELSEEFNLDEDALSIVISLIDQLHAVRGDLHRVLSAVETEPEDVRRRIAEALRQS